MDLANHIKVYSAHNCTLNYIIDSDMIIRVLKDMLLIMNVLIPVTYSSRKYMN